MINDNGYTFEFEALGATALEYDTVKISSNSLVNARIYARKNGIEIGKALGYEIFDTSDLTISY
jgi:hypothetical protein